jgi:hypothetical protein
MIKNTRLYPGITKPKILDVFFLDTTKKGLSQKSFVIAPENPRVFYRGEKLLFSVYKLSIKTSIIDRSIATRKAANLPF